MSNPKKFTPPDCTRFGGIMPDGRNVICRGQGGFMPVPLRFCNCATKYENRFDRTKDDSRERLRLFVEGERQRLENREPDYYERYFENYRDCVTFTVIDHMDRDADGRLFHRHECTGGTVWMEDENQINVTPKFIWTTYRDEVITSELFTDETRERLVDFFAKLYETSLPMSAGIC